VTVEKFGFSGVITPENPNIFETTLATAERKAADGSAWQALGTSGESSAIIDLVKTTRGCRAG
jgi:hypothetical protein